ncbi:MAG: GAF domain-containing protein [Cyanobacteria bacterium P01_F01_bin.86]
MAQDLYSITSTFSINAVPNTLPTPLAILNAIADPIWVKDQADRWVYVNDACCNLLGHSAAVLLAQPEHVGWPESTLLDLKSAQQEAVATGLAQEREIAIQDGSGQHRILSVKVDVLTDADNQLFLIHTLRDMTQRVEAEQRLQRQSRRERLLGAIAKHLLQSLSPEHILGRSVEELRRFLEVDRVLFYSLRPDHIGVVAEAVTVNQQSLTHKTEGLAFRPAELEQFRQGELQMVEQLEACELSLSQREYFKRLGVQAYVAIPVAQGDELLGLIYVQDCCRPRSWLRWEIEALQDVSTQIGSAIAQADLYDQVRQLNSELEHQVAQRTKQLQQALDFEATLKRITDRVRDSLDETQILQTAVEELTGALGARGSNTALYDLEQETSTIYYEHNPSLPPAKGRVAQMRAFPEVYHQLLEGHYFQFCSIKPHPVRGHVSMLACPIRDDRGVLGDLWLINAKGYGFEDPEIRLVQQVANQCAIAIRQARLYQESQAQVKELERLNHLKDDFLSTVSHELRTPVTSMRVALQLLGVTLNREFDLGSELRKPKPSQNPLARYYQVLTEECEREISLINDLLDLQRLDGGNHPMNPQPIDIKSWLLGITNTFQERAQSRTQSLELDIPDDLPCLVSDQASLERVFAELLNNACKYTPPGEKISITAIATATDELNIIISNTGVEIPARELPRIFDKFYRVPSADPWKQGGTGLGLALVQKLLWHIGGEIEATSRRKKTAFIVTLPLSM